MHSAEVTTATTDAILAVVTAALAARLRRLSSARHARFFAWGLCGVAVAAAAGSLFHGFRETAPEVVLWLLWRLVPVGIAVTNAGVLLGVAAAHCSRRTVRVITPLIHVKLITVATLSLIGNGLPAAGVDLAVTLAVLVGMEVPAWVRRLAGAPFVIAGAVLTAAGLLVQLSGVRHGAPWNHNDAFHLIQVLAFSLFYAAARRMSPLPEHQDASRDARLPSHSRETTAQRTHAQGIHEDLAPAIVEVRQ